VQITNSKKKIAGLQSPSSKRLCKIQGEVNHLTPLPPSPKRRGGGFPNWSLGKQEIKMVKNKKTINTFYT